MVTRSLQIARILVIDGRNDLNKSKPYYLRNGGHFLQFLLHFFQYTQNFSHFDKKDHPRSSNISKVIDPAKCGYFSACNLLFYNAISQESCSRVTNTAGTCTTLSSQFSINLGQSTLENISFSQIKNLRSFW